MADDETSNDDGPDEPTEVDDPTEADETGTDEGDGTEASEDAWTPPSKEEYDKLQATLKARNAKIAEARKRAAAAERLANGTASKPPAKKKAAPPPTPSDDGGDNDDGDAAAAEAAEIAAAERVRVTQVRVGAVGALFAAGFTGDRQAARDMAKLMDLSGIQPDADGDVDDDDLVDVLDAFKERFPQMFQAPATERRPIRRPSTVDKTQPDRKAPDNDPTARMSRRLLKQSGYR